MTSGQTGTLSGSSMRMLHQPHRGGRVQPAQRAEASDSVSLSREYSVTRTKASFEDCRLRASTVIMGTCAGSASGRGVVHRVALATLELVHATMKGSPLASK